MWSNMANIWITCQIHFWWDSHSFCHCSCPRWDSSLSVHKPIFAQTDPLIRARHWWFDKLALHSLGQFSNCLLELISIYVTILPGKFKGCGLIVAYFYFSFLNAINIGFDSLNIWIIRGKKWIAFWVFNKNRKKKCSSNHHHAIKKYMVESYISWPFVGFLSEGKEKWNSKAG